MLVDTRTQTGPKSLAPVWKASDAGAIAAEITEGVLEPQENAKEDDESSESFYIAGRSPVWLAANANLLCKIMSIAELDV